MPPVETSKIRAYGSQGAGMSVDGIKTMKRTLKSILRAALYPMRSWLLREVQATGWDAQLLLGKMASWRVRPMDVIASLQDVEFKVTSQWGEDGIIDWLIERAEIPSELHTFIEFGVENYRESNTRFLLQNRNWRGFIMDGGSSMVNTAIADGLYSKYSLSAKQVFITRENINELLASSGLGRNIGLLSVDLDGNDYWIWEAIVAVSPVICICEYNAVFGDVHPISVPYDPNFFLTSAHYSHLYWGASIAALRSLAAKKGYRFVGTTLAGNDAFFVREDFAKKFVDTSLLQIQARPQVARYSLNESGKMTCVDVMQRPVIIGDMPVINTETGARTRLRDLKTLYSQEWLKRLGGEA
jgi:hypothetical protein